MWNPKIINTDHVLYMAIADAIERDLNLNILKPGDKMPPQRALAQIIGVNLTTITRAYKEAERRGIIIGIKGSGTFVASRESKNERLPEVLQDPGELMDLGLVSPIRVPEFTYASWLQEVFSEKISEELLGYVPSQGLLRHRIDAAQWMSQYGVEAQPDLTVISSGALHALNCVLMSQFSPGDRIAVDCLTFTGFKNAAQLHHVKLEGIEMDEEGMKPDSLELLCSKMDIKGIYLMPNLQNPTAGSMSSKRKVQIAQVIKRYGLLLIEDDIYSFTQSENKLALSSLLPEQSIFICSLSKAFFPGLRIAFVKVPEAYYSSFIHALSSTIWMAPPLNAEILLSFLQSGLAQQLAEKKRTLLESRHGLAKEILKGHPLQADEHAMYIWLKLPKGWEATEFENVALLHRVRVVASPKFYVGTGLPPNAIRISLSGVDDLFELENGLRVIQKILEEGPHLVATLL